MSSTFSTDGSNDLFLDSNNNIAIYKDQINVCKQLCQNYTQTFLSEVFTDNTLGLDWFGIMFNEFVSLNDKILELKRVLLTVPYVLDIISVQYSQDKTTSTVTFEVDVLTEFGTINLDDIIVSI
jgi:hypothetical protein